MKEIDEICRHALNIPSGAPEIDEVVNWALKFICNVEWFSRDTMLLYDNGEFDRPKTSAHYLLKASYIKKCEESRADLAVFYNYVDAL